MLRALLGFIRRFLSRRAARRLLAQELPRGIREQRLALPAAPRQPPAGEFWTVGRRPARLFRLAALPRAPRLAVFDPQKFRLDADGHAPANVRILAFPPRGETPAWLLPAFRRRFLRLPPMARSRSLFLGPTAAEWFALWWEQSVAAAVGPGEPDERERPDEVEWAMEHCKEQMLIRRDVVKDEHGPERGEPSAPRIGHPVRAWEPAQLRELVPDREWIEIAEPRVLAPPPRFTRAHRDAYLRWRLLMDALG